MSKPKASFSCSNCSYKSIKWLGCCPDCNEWNTFVESRLASPSSSMATSGVSEGTCTSMTPLQSIKHTSQKRMLTNIHEWDRVMGGGIMPSSLIILTGDPGIGKSTLLLQISDNLAQEYKVYYFSTEESLQQILQRANRLKCTSERLLCSDQANVETIIATTQQDKPDILIIDSIQNCYVTNAHSAPGSISQLREITFQLMRLAKEHNITVIVSGHITKEGVMAGPKTLEHMVDAVFYLQAEDRWQTRVLRAVKNRFGTINELGFFHMHEDGLQEEPNINKHLLSDHTHSPGSVLVSVIEGSRPLLLELQALTIESKLGIPQRVVSGLDHKQVVLIAAILQKYLFIKLNVHDIFFKVSGGVKIKGSSTDVGIALALLSSYFQQPVPEKSMALGEISLTGSIKPVSHINILIKEAQKFGIEQFIVAKNQKIEKTSSTTIVRRFSTVYDLLSLFAA
ncbi:MAG: DNA repair protein RadA [Candidatus Dependentiae bacterium]|nr:DNA repair protein RadA [Candidatus Dependentiae bacterium]